MLVWQGDTGSLLEVTSMDKPMDRRSMKRIILLRKNGEFTWSLEVQGRPVGSYRQSRELHGHCLCHTNTSGCNLNSKFSVRHAEREPSSKLLKYVFCSVLHSFVLNDPTDGGTFF